MMSGLFGAVLILAWIGWRRHQNSLSPEVNAAALAILHDNTSYVDASTYLRAAKLASRTKHDFDIVERLDRMLELESQALEDQRLSLEHVPMVRPC